LLIHIKARPSAFDIVLPSCSYLAETQVWQDGMLLDTRKRSYGEFLCQLGGLKTCRILDKEEIDNSGTHICGFAKPLCGSPSLMVA